MKPVFSVDEMRQADSLTIDKLNGFGVLLMEHAGTACVNTLKKSFREELKNKNITIICGKGNNGGDGLVIARQLVSDGIGPKVYLMEGNLSKDTELQFNILSHFNVELNKLSKENIEEFEKVLRNTDILVDALLGTGLNKEVNGFYAQVIETIKVHHKNFTLAVDIPSGLSGDFGILSEIYLKADFTVTFGALKYCHVFYPSNAICGEIIVDKITIPKSVFEKVDPKLFLSEICDFEFLKKNHKIDSHKGNFGHVGIIGGVPGKLGASLLAGYSALKSGCGLVTILIDKNGYKNFSPNYPELMFEICENHYSLDSINKFIIGKNVIAIGPGFGLENEAKNAVIFLTKTFQGKIVLDADVFKLFNLEEFKELNLSKRVVITPHPGEMSSFLGIPKEQIQRNRLEITKNVAKQLDIITILKGMGTLISDRGEKTILNTTGNSALSTAGSGDVLTGIIASLIGQGYPLFDSAVAGVYLHGLAGDIANEKEGRAFVSATSIIKYLKKAYKRVLNG